MKLLTIISSSTQHTSTLLKDACESLGVEHLTVDISEEFPSDIQLGPDVFVYRLSDTQRGILFEMLAIGQGCKSFYKNPNIFTTNWDNVLAASLIHHQNDIPIPNTVFSCPKEKEAIEKSVQLVKLPLVVKVTGGQKGIGVIKVDSLNSLFSVCDYLHSQNMTFILREFIETGLKPTSFRAIVLGEKVVFSYKNQSVSTGDFRSNVNQNMRQREEISLSEEEEETCVKAVHLLNLYLGGVDFLYNKKGGISILEVNFPFNFAPVVKDLGFPIHEQIIGYIKSL